MEIDPTRLFRFRFKSPGMSDNMCYYVLTDDVEKMKMFLLQHGFNQADINVDVVWMKDHEDDGEYMLEPFMLKSNYSNKVYRIMSTEHLMNECANSVASIMSSSLVFGQWVIKNDIPIMQVISELVDQLDHTYVLDHTICDPETGKPYSSQYEKYTKCGFPDPDTYNNAYMYEGEPAAYDDSALYESLTNINRDHPLTFTLEAYISYFAELLTDQY